jgi:predicted  nucleic acid-binding Zn-ribbon protein
MCTLAVTAQLGGAQMCELNAHIATCASCRKVLESLAQVSVQTMPLLADKRAPIAQAVPPSGMRDRFLSRLISEELGRKNATDQHRVPVAFMKPFAIAAEGGAVAEDREENRAVPVSRLALPVSLWRSLATLGACVVFGIAAYRAGEWKSGHAPQPLAQVHALIAPVPQLNPSANDSNLVMALEQQKSEWESRLVKLKQELSTAQSDREALSNELATAKEKLATLTAQVTNASQARPVIAQQAGEVSGLQAQVGQLSQRLAESEVNLGIQKQTSDELSARLDATAAQLQRERDLQSAKSEIGGLMAARNLHIVDVYDADPNGKRQRSFGRVFYIEAKSLVFYAYDLDDSRQFKANVVFHVWGGRAGVKEVTHSLGILLKDDASQNRWAMTFDDPNVLAQINSVFVTAESANKHYDEPHGKKVLYAYFGSPANHP